jgi:RimJ/RimL family protein N-acetyltransferase
MSYKCLKEQTFAQLPYILMTIRNRDMLLIKEWRNEQIAILRQNIPLSDAEQERYWTDVITPSFKEEQPQQILFSLLHAGKCIGYGGLTHINWNAKRGEVSFLLQTERSYHPQIYKKDFLHFLSLLKKVAFEDLCLNRLFTETFDVRPEHIAALEKFGFQEEGRLKQHVKIEGRYVDSLIHGYLRKFDTEIKSKFDF